MSTMRISLLYMIFAVAIGFATVQLAYASPNGTVSATVGVACPFKISISPPAFAVKGFNADFNYTAYVPLPADCSLPNASGFFSVSNNTNSDMLNTGISGININTTSANVIHTLVKSISLSPGTYTANISLSDVSNNSSSSSFTVLLYPELNITQMYQNQAYNLYATHTVYINYTDEGNLAVINATLHINVTGPMNVSLALNVGGVSPESIETISASLPFNATSKVGTYTTSAYFTYKFDGKPYASARKSSSYSVIALPPPAPTGPSISSIVAPISPIPYLNITSIPIYIAMQQNSSNTASISLLNPGNLTETLSISVPKEYSSMISLSSTAITLPSHQSLSDGIYIHVNASLPSSTYIIPISINTTSQNGLTSTYREFITLSVSTAANTEPSATNELYISNNTHSATGTSKITAPYNAPLSNATVSTIIPFYSTSSISNINAYGLPNKIVKTGSGYEIQWFVSYLPPGQSTYGYYAISSVTNLQTLLSTSQSISFIRPAIPPKLLDVLSIGVPTFYVNSTNNITIDVLYTGSAPQNVSLSLTGPVPQRIINPDIVFNALPNQVISANFYVTTGKHTGTLLLYLNIMTAGASLNYSIPAIVAAQPQITAAPPATGIGMAISGLFKDFEGYINRNIYAATIYLAIGIVALAALILALKAHNKAGKSNYSKERAMRLIELREHIKRGYAHETLHNKNRLAKRGSG